jgi:hypothetical protein
LLYYHLNSWNKTDIQIPCYDVIFQDIYLTASTEIGLLCEMSGKWMNIAYPNWITYQLLITPELLFLGSQYGIAMYDCLTGLWHEFYLNTGVTSMAVYHKRLIGVTEQGNLMVGDMQGGFVETSFDHIFIYSLKQHQNEAYICTNRGLYRISVFNNNLVLRSVELGYAVTDLQITNDYYIITTFQNGIKKIKR